MCQYCKEEKQSLDSFNICEDCVFQMAFEDRQKLKNIVLEQFDELNNMVTDHEQMGNITVDSKRLALSVHNHLQNIKKVVRAL